MAGPIELPPGWALDDAPPVGQPPQQWQPPAGWVLDPPPPPTAAERALGDAKSLGSGAVSGAMGMTADLPYNLQALMAMGWDKAVGKVGLDSLKVAPMHDEINKRDVVQQGVKSATAAVREQLHKPNGPEEEAAHRIGEFAPGAVIGPGGAAQRIAAQWLAPAISSEVAGNYTKGTAAEPYARFGGAVMGGFVPTVAGRFVTPLPATPQRAAATAALADEGVTSLTAGQRTGFKPLQYAESAAAESVGGGRLADTLDQQGRQFTQAAVNRIGENSDTAGGVVLRRARTRLKNEFEALSGATDMDFFGSQAGRQAYNDIARRVHASGLEYQHDVMPNAQHRMVGEVVNDIQQALRSGRIDGRQYQTWRSELTRNATDAAHSDPKLSRFLSETRDALDDAAMSLSPPDIQARWAAARDQWAHLKTLQGAMERGESAANGIVTPRRLDAADVAHNPLAHVEETGLYTDLAHNGQLAMPQLPNSGTAPRNLAYGTMAAVGSVPGIVTGNMPLAGAGALLAPAAGHIFGARFVSNPYVQGYVGNQVARNHLNGLNARRAAMISALLASGDPWQEHR